MSNVVDPNATAAPDRLSSAISAFKGETAFEHAHMDTTVTEDEVLQDDGNVLDQFFSGQESEEPQPSQSSQEDLNVPSQADIEEIVVSDDRGRRKVKVDWNDRDDIKKKIQLAAGARKWQAERDQAQAKLKELQEPAELMQELEQAYKSRGVEGVIDRIEGRQGAYQEYVKKQIERYEARRNADPDELAAMDKQEAYEKQQAILRQMQEDNRKLRDEFQTREEQMQEKAVRSVVEPTFDRYRFAGKLNNPDQEHMLDQMVWTSALKKLEPYEANGHEITPELVNRAFRSASNSIRKMVNLQSEKKAQKIVSKKKQEAAEHAQQAVTRGVKSSQENSAAKEMLQRGDLMGFFKNYGKNLKF